MKGFQLDFGLDAADLPSCGSQGDNADESLELRFHLLPVPNLMLILLAKRLQFDAKSTRNVSENARWHGE